MEKIEDIAKSIKRHRELEVTIRASNSAFGRSQVIFNNENTIFWLTNCENKGGASFRRDITGAVSETIPGNRTTISEDGCPIYKNTKIGEILILNHEGKHNIKTPIGDKEIEIHNRASYNPSCKDDEYATDILIKLSGDSRTHSFQNISKILSLQIEIDKDKVNLEHANNQETQDLLKRIEDKERELKSYLDKAQSFVRKYAELRYQPILDPIQESIKRSHIFDGTLIINGGPGTGKTTSLIQRIKFLNSHSIEEYVNLSIRQKELLFQQDNNWIFYSPNELLALFLRNSMKMEGLAANTENVKVWNSHKNELVKTYKFVDTATKRPFMIYNKSEGVSLFVNKPDAIKDIFTDFNAYYLNFQKDKLNKIVEVDLSQFKWKNTGFSIQKYINSNRDIKNIDEVIRLFINLNETYKIESDKVADEYFQLVKQTAGRIQISLTKDSVRAAALNDLLKGWKTNSQDLDEEEDDEADIELEDFEEKEDQNAFDFEKELFNKLKSLCRKQALRTYDKKTKISKRDKELIKLIPEVEHQDEFNQIGQTAFYKKYFERLTKGLLANVFREIPLIYKRFRREQLLSKNKNWNLLILEELVSKDKNSRIHSDEQSLLLYTTNSICYALSKKFNKQYKALNHPYLNTYKSNCKSIIGIDEAADFSIIDLLSVISFKHPELSSITLSGDIMQRMTSDGLGSWSDIVPLIPKSEIMNLEVSYRQSPTLLSLAQSIYEKATGIRANYRTYIEKDKVEPKPLLFVSEDEDEKLMWIADRIIEIHKAYGDSIPSIAIFLPDESMLEVFASKLGKLDNLSDVGILVKACRNGEVLGDMNTVRIFSIDKIKGLEFEAVFFHNLDKLQFQELSDELLLKYLYVGLSRATFYLGLTISNKLANNLDFISDCFEKEDVTWMI